MKQRQANKEREKEGQSERKAPFPNIRFYCITITLTFTNTFLASINWRLRVPFLTHSLAANAIACPLPGAPFPRPAQLRPVTPEPHR